MAVEQEPRSGNRRALELWMIPLVIGLVVGLLLLTDPPLWWKNLFGGGEELGTQTTGTDQGPSVVGFVGSCEPFRVVAQNRYNPPGARRLIAPDVLAEQVGGFGPNQVLAVDGWVHSTVAYPTNSPPFNSDIWFHLADDSGWVAFAAVRANPTVLDPTGLDPDGGTPAATPSTCEGAIQ